MVIGLLPRAAAVADEVDDPASTSAEADFASRYPRWPPDGPPQIGQRYRIGALGFNPVGTGYDGIVPGQESADFWRIAPLVESMLSTDDVGQPDFRRESEADDLDAIVPLGVKPDGTVFLVEGHHRFIASNVADFEILGEVVDIGAWEQWEDKEWVSWEEFVVDSSPAYGYPADPLPEEPDFRTTSTTDGPSRQLKELVRELLRSDGQQRTALLQAERTRRVNAAREAGGEKAAAEVERTWDRTIRDDIAAVIMEQFAEARRPAEEAQPLPASDAGDPTTGQESASPNSSPFPPYEEIRPWMETLRALSRLSGDDPETIARFRRAAEAVPEEGATPDPPPAGGSKATSHARAREVTGTPAAQVIGLRAGTPSAQSGREVLTTPIPEPLAQVQRTPGAQPLPGAGSGGPFGASCVGLPAGLGGPGGAGVSLSVAPCVGPTRNAASLPSLLRSASSAPIGPVPPGSPVPAAPAAAPEVGGPDPGSAPDVPDEPGEEEKDRDRAMEIAEREAGQDADRAARDEERRVEREQIEAERQALLDATMAAHNAAVEEGERKQRERDNPPLPPPAPPATEPPPLSAPPREPEEDLPEDVDDTDSVGGQGYVPVAPAEPVYVPEAEPVIVPAAETAPVPEQTAPAPEPEPEAVVLPDCAPDLSYMSHCGGTGEYVQYVPLPAAEDPAERA